MQVTGIERMSPGEEGTESSLQHAECHFKGLILKCHIWKYAHLNATHLKPPMKFRYVCSWEDNDETGWYLPMGKRRLWGQMEGHSLVTGAHLASSCWVGKQDQDGQNLFYFLIFMWHLCYTAGQSTNNSDTFIEWLYSWGYSIFYCDLGKEFLLLDPWSSIRTWFSCLVNLHVLMRSTNSVQRRCIWPPDDNISWVPPGLFIPAWRETWRFRKR